MDSIFFLCKRTPLSACGKLRHHSKPSVSTATSTARARGLDADTAQQYHKIVDECGADALADLMRTRHAGRTLTMHQSTASSAVVSTPLTSTLAVASNTCCPHCRAAFETYIDEWQVQHGALPTGLLRFLLNAAPADKFGHELGAITRLAAFLLYVKISCKSSSQLPGSPNSGNAVRGGAAAAASDEGGVGSPADAGQVPRFQTYLNMIPRLSEFNCFAAYSDPRCQLALQLPALIAEAKQQYSWAQAVHELYLSRNLGSRSDYFQLSSSFVETLWALAVARTRSLTLSIGDAAPTGGEQARLSALVPVADFINHSFTPNCEFGYNPAKRAVEVWPLERLSPGDEVAISYGQHRDNLDLMCDYGFLEIPNANDRLLLPQEAKHLAMKLQQPLLVKAAKRCLPSGMVCGIELVACFKAYCI